MPPRRTSAGIIVRYVGAGPADRVPQVRGRGRATLDRHPQPHIPPRRVLRPATFCDRPASTASTNTTGYGYAGLPVRSKTVEHNTNPHLIMMIPLRCCQIGLSGLGKLFGHSSWPRNPGTERRIGVSQPTSPPPRRNARRASAAEQTGSEDRSDDVDVVQPVPCSSRSAVIFAALGVSCHRDAGRRR